MYCVHYDVSKEMWQFQYKKWIKKKKIKEQNSYVRVFLPLSNGPAATNDGVNACKIFTTPNTLTANIGFQALVEPCNMENPAFPCI